MDFPTQLETILVNRKVGSTTASSLRDDKPWTDWNDQIETFLSKPPTKDILSQEVNDAALISSLKNASTKLLRLLLLSVWTRNKSPSLFDDTDIDEASTTQEANIHFVESGEPFNETSLFQCIRTGKNLLRWYIQIYLECQSRAPVENPMLVLQETATLELMVNLLNWSVCSTKEGCDARNGARYCSLYLFYATYSPFPGDVTMSHRINFLLSELDFPNVALDILTQIESVALALSLVRNLHNMAVSIPGAGKIILGSQLQFDPSTSTHAAPWSPKESCIVSIRSICVNILSWSLSASAGQDFPGDNLEDKRSELVTEILRSFYALGIGNELKSSSESTTLDDGGDNNTLAEVVARILQFPHPPLPSSETMTMDMKVGNRIGQCQLCAVSLLMDSNASFGTYLLQSNATQSLLQILTVQVNDVVHENRVDSSATAALVPILAVLNKYAMGEVQFRQRVKDFVFPPEEEANFEAKVREYIASKASSGISGGNKSVNMSPLDAPRNTIRGKLVLLLSWPESYIKRCTAELLWTLCSADATEYVHRVGFGNALPLLNSKGLAPMPIATNLN